MIDDWPDGGFTPADLPTAELLLWFLLLLATGVVAPILLLTVFL